MNQSDDDFNILDVLRAEMLVESARRVARQHVDEGGEQDSPERIAVRSSILESSDL